MPDNRRYPGVYVQEIGAPPSPVDIPTSITAFVGRTVKGPVNAPVEVNDWADYEAAFGGLDDEAGVSWQVRAYFDNGGAQALVVRLVSAGGEGAALTPEDWLGSRAAKTGLYALETAPVFNILCLPPDGLDGDTPPAVLVAAADYCVERDAMLILDPPTRWQALYEAGKIGQISPDDLGSFETESGRSTAVYFPRVKGLDPRDDGMTERVLPGCGAVAGVWARTDRESGVWKAPAGLSAALAGVTGPAAKLTDAQNGVLNPQGINCLREMINYGTVVWGARTLRGADHRSDGYQYVPSRRLALYIKGWVRANTTWAAFEPNGPALWARLTAQTSAFLNGLWKQGALFGSSADQGYFVRCDASTTTAEDIEAGVVNIQIGFSAVKPAEFLILLLQVKTAQG